MYVFARILPKIIPPEPPVLDLPLTFIAEEPNARIQLGTGTTGDPLVGIQYRKSLSGDWTICTDEDYSLDIILENEGDIIQFQNLETNFGELMFYIGQGKIAASR